MDPLIYSLAFALIAVVTFLSVRPFDGRVTLPLALLGSLYLGMDDFVTGLPSSVGALDLLGGHWNWTGKLFSLALSVLAMATLRLSCEAVGLTFRQRQLKVGILALVLFVVWGGTLGWLFNPGAADAETLLFQATMPGLAEELAYRGIAPAILLGLVRGQGAVEGMPWAVIVAVSILFGVWHGLSYSDGHFGFAPLSALFPLIGSIPGGWLRFKTGSLIVPVLGHGLANLAFHSVGGL
jgi:uncharacterized protein